MSEKWFYRVFAEEFGPVSLDDLRGMAANSTLSGDDEVRPEELTMWVPAKAVRELQDFYHDAIESKSDVTNTMNAAAESPAPADEWYYRMADGDETEVGPLLFDALIEHAKRGRLTSDDEVRFGVDGKWRRAGSMGRLVAVLPYQSRRRNPAPVPKDEVLETAPKPDTVQDLLNSLPEQVPPEQEVSEEEAVDEPMLERETLRPKSRDTAIAHQSEATDRKTPAPKSMARRPDPKMANKASKAKANELAKKAAAKLEQEIEDQILEELMTPSSEAAEAAATTAMPAFPTSASPAPAIPQESAADTPHVTSAANSSFNSLTTAPISRPAFKPVKPPRSGPSLAERLKNPNLLKGLTAVVVLGLFVGWMNMTPGKGADIARYRELDGLFAELKQLREKDKEGKKLIPFKTKLEEASARILKEIERSASSDFPARQQMLWAIKNNIPTILSSLAIESDAEKQAIANLNQAAILLGLKDAPKVQMVASSNKSSD